MCGFPAGRLRRPEGLQIRPLLLQVYDGGGAANLLICITVFFLIIILPTRLLQSRRILHHGGHELVHLRVSLLVLHHTLKRSEQFRVYLQVAWVEFHTLLLSLFLLEGVIRPLVAAQGLLDDCLGVLAGGHRLG